MASDIENYISQSRNAGISDDQIRSSLLQQGWQESAIANSLTPQQSIPPLVSLSPTPSRGRRMMKFIGGLILLAVLVVLAISIIKPSVWIVAVAKWNLSASESPELAIIPTQRTISATPREGALILSFENLLLSSPFDEQPQIIAGTATTRFIFSNERSILVFHMPSLHAQMLESGTPEEVANVTKVLGEEAITSNAKLYKAVLNTSPKQLSYLMDSAEAARINVLLLMKRLFVLTQYRSASYVTSLSQGVAYQMGDPSVEKNKIALVDYFDQNDKQFELVFRGCNQNEIDFVISSLQTQ